ncbi:MAG: DUF1580 domain-containing protein [bacterium]|nr:DUF1580 domain-containing protein [bacterium]
MASTKDPVNVETPSNVNPEFIRSGLADDHWARNEQIITLTSVPKHWLKRVHISVAYRWIDSGADGVVLESFTECGQRFTTVEALQRFRRKRNANLANGSARESQSRAASRRVRDRLAKA